MAATNDGSSSCSFRFLLANVGDAEELERYERGGWHPVHLGDLYDSDRYRIIHKLGAGGFSTVWLARDLTQQKWVALKIVLADESLSVETKTLLSNRVASQCKSNAVFITYDRYFHIDGPNGRHLCLVLPVLGPSASTLTRYLESRIEPWLVRRTVYQAAKALSDLHAQNLCHGDLTPANIMFQLVDFDRYSENDIYRLFGQPETGPLETQSGEIPGSEAPRYIVKTLDFLSSTSDIISNDIKLIDFDQAFLISSPPEKMLATPVEYLAPEVAVGQSASPASDVWALGCSIVRTRAGEGLFSAYDITSPADLMRSIIQALGDVPATWGDTLFDYDGQPTKDPAKGEPLWRFTDEQPIKERIYSIYDNPGSNPIIWTGDPSIFQGHIVDPFGGLADHQPYPRCFEYKFWKPTAIKIGDIYLDGYADIYHDLVKAMPKIPEDEASLLYDLLSKIFVFEPSERASATEILDHPWFHIDD